MGSSGCTIKARRRPSQQEGEKGGGSHEDRRLKFEEEQFNRLQNQEEARVSELKEKEAEKKQMVNKMLQEGRSPTEITALVRLIYG
jgi:hypothetical protein